MHFSAGCIAATSYVAAPTPFVGRGGGKLNRALRGLNEKFWELPIAGIYDDDGGRRTTGDNRRTTTKGICMVKTLLPAQQYLTQKTRCEGTFCCLKI